MLYIWDFVLVPDDGTRVALHPNWSDTKVECKWDNLGKEDTELPRTGLGGTSGRKTLRYFRQEHADRWLRFDNQKKVAQAKAKAKHAVAAKAKAKPAVAAASCSYY